MSTPRDRSGTESPGSHSVLVHLTSGIGNIILATPLLIGLDQLGFSVDVLLDADYPATAELLAAWSAVRRTFLAPDRSRIEWQVYDHVVPAATPFYWTRFAGFYRNMRRVIARPPDGLFYDDEQEYYFSFARALGYGAERPFYRLPIAPSFACGVSMRTVMLAPGSKTGEMSAKRWPFFSELAGRFDDVAVVGTADDLKQFDGNSLHFPPHARLLVDQLSLRGVAEVLASAGVVVGNDAGLTHVAAASGVTTVMLFGPTPHISLGRLPPNVKVLRSGLPCEPCWFNRRLSACARALDCLKELSVERVEREIRAEIQEPPEGREQLH